MSFTLIKPTFVRASIGRVRVTSSAKVSEKGYIRSMRKQMKEIARVIDASVENVKGATAEGIAFALEPIMVASQELVPVDTSKLKDSGFIEVRQTTSGPVAHIGYARHGQPFYAAFVHEMTQIPHQKGKSAKFLEIAINNNLGLFKRRLIRHIKENSGLKK